MAPYLIACVCAPLLVIGSTALPYQGTVRSYADTQAVPYGYPLKFAKSRIDIAPRPPDVEARTFYPDTAPFNPWENPTSIDGIRFAGSVGIVAATVGLLVFLSRWVRNRRRRGSSPSPAASSVGSSE